MLETSNFMMSPLSMLASSDLNFHNSITSPAAWNAVLFSFKSHMLSSCTCSCNFQKNVVQWSQEGFISDLNRIERIAFACTLFALLFPILRKIVKKLPAICAQTLCIGSKSN